MTLPDAVGVIVAVAVGIGIASYWVFLRASGNRIADVVGVSAFALLGFAIGTLVKLRLQATFGEALRFGLGAGVVSLGFMLLMLVQMRGEQLRSRAVADLVAAEAERRAQGEGAVPKWLVRPYLAMIVILAGVVVFGGFWSMILQLIAGVSISANPHPMASDRYDAAHGLVYRFASLSRYRPREFYVGWANAAVIWAVRAAFAGLFVASLIVLPFRVRRKTAE